MRWWSLYKPRTSGVWRGLWETSVISLWWLQSLCRWHRREKGYYLRETVTKYFVFTKITYQFSFDYVIVYLINFFFTDMCYRTKSKVSDLLTCVPMDTRFGINTSVTMWQDRVCDGVPHCLNGQDEAFCVTGIPGGYLQIVQLESKHLYSHYINITVAYVYSTMAIWIW